jgi:hypothetical protein
MDRAMYSGVDMNFFFPPGHGAAASFTDGRGERGYTWAFGPPGSAPHSPCHERRHRPAARPGGDFAVPCRPVWRRDGARAAASR